MIATNILPFHLDPVDCSHTGWLSVHRDRQGHVWLACRRCGQRSIGYTDQNTKYGKPSGLTLAAASFWSGDSAMLDAAYRYQPDAPDNPTREVADTYWAQRRGRDDEGA